MEKLRQTSDLAAGRSASGSPASGKSASSRFIAFTCVAVVASMVGLAYASVPLYRLFCQITGYGGTTQVVAQASEEILDRTMNIRFDANTADIPWDFAPAQTEIKIRVGENKLAFYSATNPTSEKLTGTATFNVTPLEAGAYFNKIDCFCFTEQTLEPGVSVQMPVSFFVDPSIADNPELDDVKTITLSYTFFQTDNPEEEQDVVINSSLIPAARVN